MDPPLFFTSFPFEYHRIKESLIFLLWYFGHEFSYRMESVSLFNKKMDVLSILSISAPQVKKQNVNGFVELYLFEYPW